jgi:hypothetical protein
VPEEETEPQLELVDGEQPNEEQLWYQFARESGAIDGLKGALKGQTPGPFIKRLAKLDPPLAVVPRAYVKFDPSASVVSRKALEAVVTSLNMMKGELADAGLSNASIEAVHLTAMASLGLVREGDVETG